MSQKKVYNKFFLAQGMEFLGGVTGPFEQCAMIVSIVAHCSKALATLPRNSIPCAEKIYCRLFSGTPCRFQYKKGQQQQIYINSMQMTQRKIVGVSESAECY